MYLTREQAAAELVSAGSNQDSAGSILDHALAIYPQCARTAFHLITGYAAGTIMDAYYPGNPGIPEDLFTISPW